MTRTPSRRAKPKPPPSPSAGAAAPSVRALQQQLREATTALQSERERHARQLDAVRRDANRKLAELVREIVALRHHQARAEMLTRLLAERDAAARQESTHAEAPRSARG